MTKLAKVTGPKTPNKPFPKQATPGKIVKKGVMQSGKKSANGKLGKWVEEFVKIEPKVDFPKQGTKQSPSSINKKQKVRGIKEVDDAPMEISSKRPPKQNKIIKNQKGVGNKAKFEIKKQGKMHLAKINKAKNKGLIIKTEPLRTEMTNSGVPSEEIARTTKALQRKSKGSKPRTSQKTCYKCHKTGHTFSNCPEIEINQLTLKQFDGPKICYKCGSNEHAHSQCHEKGGYKFATCFICREQGHISRECPNNPKGLSLLGNSCKSCGDVTHFKKDCPKMKQKQVSNELLPQSDDIASDDIESDIESDIGSEDIASDDIGSSDNASETSEMSPEEQEPVLL